MRNFVVLCSIAALSFVVATPAAAQKLCPGPKSPERTACLNAEIEKTKKEQKRIDAGNKVLDAAIVGACVGDAGMAVAASSVGGVAGGTAYAGTRVVTNAATKGKSKCPHY